MLSETITKLELEAAYTVRTKIFLVTRTPDLLESFQGW